jgi:hypothetical protein
MHELNVSTKEGESSGESRVDETAVKVQKEQILLVTQ